MGKNRVFAPDLRPRYRSAHFFPVKAASALVWLLAAFTALSVFAGSALALPAGTVITNTARATYFVNGVETEKFSNTNTIVMVAARTASSIRFLHYAPNTAQSEPVMVRVTFGGSVNAGGPFSALAPPMPAGKTEAIDLSNPIPLCADNPCICHAGEPLFIMVSDQDQNTDPDTAQTVIVTVVSNGDTEVLSLTETGPDTGIFAGYIQSVSTAFSTPGNGFLTVKTDSVITATYNDPVDGSDTASAASLVDPYGAVFDSATGQPVDGATVTLMNADTGHEAAVYGDDGVSTFPATVVSGGSVRDSSGRAYDFPSGGYRYPFVPPGRYSLIVTPPEGYTAPSVVSAENLQKLSGAPFAIVNGSRGEVFTVSPGPALRLDLPVDPKSGGIFLTKTASEDTASVGDFLSFTLSLSNGGKAALGSAVLSDRLPLGFRYKKGSLKIDGKKAADPGVSKDGRTLYVPLPDLASGAATEIFYVVEVSAGARPGMAYNAAVATGKNAASNKAVAGVLVKDAFFRDAAFIVGRVAKDSCGKDGEARGEGVSGVRVFLEDGSFSVTDKLGLFHFEGVKPGVHVVQMDLASLPKDLEPVPCKGDTSLAGRSFSRFADLARGSLWRADFNLAKKPEPQGEVGVILSGKRGNDSTGWAVCITGRAAHVKNLSVMAVLPEGAQYIPKEGMEEPTVTGNILTWRLGAYSGDWTRSITFLAKLPSPDGSMEVKTLAVFDPPGDAKKVSLPVALSLEKPGDSLTNRASAGVKQPPAVSSEETGGSGESAEQSLDPAWLAGAEPGFEFVLPREGYLPPIPSMKAAIKHGPAEKIELFVNGAPVDRANFEGTFKNQDQTVFLSSWGGVPLIEGDNVLDAVTYDEAGAETGRISRVIHYSSPPVSARFLPEKSVLSADGRNPVVLAFALADKDGYPARLGVVGTFSVDEPYAAWEDAKAADQDPLARTDEKRAVYTVGEGGVALIKIAETSRPGEAVVRFPFSTGEVEARAWILPESREWILVGLAEGTAGWSAVSGNVENLSDSYAKEDFYSDGRLAFFAKGRVKGSWLLTLAYDSGRDGEDDAQAALFGQVDPDEYYTVYGDASVSGQAAPSREKLFIRIERDRFYFLYGDFDTGLSVTELSRYSRKATGAQVRYAGERLEVSAFATRTGQNYAKDEIPGDGTSGLYHLSQTGIVEHSETVSIEVRDRLRSEKTVSTARLSRDSDYTIDYDTGAIWFKEPVNSRDEGMNPVYIVVEYETTGTQRDFSYGGRAAVKGLGGRVEAGVTAVHESSGNLEGDLGGLDLTVAIGRKTTLKAETAATRKDEGEGEASGAASLLEISHKGERLTAEVYAREHGVDFGLGQQSVSEASTRKIGADARYRAGQALDLEGLAYRQTNLETDAVRDVAEAKARYSLGSGAISAGYRLARDEMSDGSETTVQQALLGASANLWADRLRLRLDHEQNMTGESGNADFPTRTILGVDYRLFRSATLFAEQELSTTDDDDTQRTRMGVKSTPWTGGKVETALENRYRESGAMLFAILGLGQSVSPLPGVKLDFSFEQGSTMSGGGAAATAQPASFPSSASTDQEDFTAFSAGAAKSSKLWSTTSRIEYRTSDSEDKWGVSLGFYGEPVEGAGFSAGLKYFDTDRADGNGNSSADLRFGFVWRPEGAKLIILDRLDLIWEDEAGSGQSTENHRIVNNANFNFLLGPKTQMDVKYGAKYVLAGFSGDRYSGFTDFIGISARYDITEKWDVGFSGGILHGWNAGLYEYTIGPSVGTTLMDNVWVSVGYNFAGFEDEDFSSAGFTAQGPYIQCRIKFDQQTAKELVKLFSEF